MNEPLTAHQLAERILSAANLPSDGTQVLAIPLSRVRALIMSAVTEDRNTGPIDFEAIADKILSSYSHGETTLAARNAVLAALRYAQASGARFQAGPTEGDYAEGIQAALEAFCATLKDKGLWP